jgi:ATP-dependent DNA helicase DinG
VVEAALPVLKASRGRAFLLFTSHRALRRAHELLQGPHRVSAAGAGHRLAQRAAGALPAAGQRGAAGRASFWEGVDVRGEALSVVLIDKLPFAPPDDPVLAARIEALRDEAATRSWITSCRRRCCN